ncbi:HEAT repeat domain-containing protein, partial [Corallococcus sp. 4LFB]
MADWRAERDRALLTLEREKRPASRAEAADLLFQLASEEPTHADAFADVLVRLLADAQPEVRRSGVSLASVILPPEQLPDMLLPRLRDEDTRVRLEATGRLADLALPHARGALPACWRTPPGRC